MNYKSVGKEKNKIIMICKKNKDTCLLNNAQMLCFDKLIVNITKNLQFSTFCLWKYISKLIEVADH